ncbi:hypothetical protein FKM82_006770 [Ascaphus truei]
MYYHSGPPSGGGVLGQSRAQQLREVYPAETGNWSRQEVGCEHCDWLRCQALPLLGGKCIPLFPLPQR